MLSLIIFLISFVNSVPISLNTFTFTGTGGSGDGTYYSSTGGSDGHCSLPRSVTDLYAAIPTSLWKNGYYCGLCASVKGPKGTVKVKIMDECAGCTEAGSLDLSITAFNQIADMSAGRVSIVWNFEPCVGADAVPLSLDWVSGSNEYWFAFVVLGNTDSIHSISLNNQILTHKSDNTFVGNGVGPFSFVLKYENGQSVTMDGLTLNQVQLEGLGVTQIKPIEPQNVLTQEINKADPTTLASVVSSLKENLQANIPSTISLVPSLSDIQQSTTQYFTAPASTHLSYCRAYGY